MKKKLAGLLAALMVLSMGTTVFAATSPTAEDIAKAESVAQVSADGATLSKTAIEKSDYSEASKKAEAISEKATVMAAFELSADGNATFPLTVTITVAGISAGDSISVLHKKTDGTWETISPATVADGYIVATFNSLSPVAVVRTATAAENAAAGSGDSQDPQVVNNYYYTYTNPSASTGTTSATNGNTSSTANNSGVTQSNNNNQVVNVYTTAPTAATSGTSTSNTSPKTGAAVPVLPLIAVFAVTGIAVCTKKARSL